MDDNEQKTEVQPSSEQFVVIASIARLVSSLFSYWIARRAVELLEARWVQWLVYAIIPIIVTFIILYRSCWHSEITGAARTCSLLLLSSIILIGMLFVIGIMLCMGWFCLNAVTGGSHP
jgi:hypothetical protein